jgi:hypothetical protein
MAPLIFCAVSFFLFTETVNTFNELIFNKLEQKKAKRRKKGCYYMKYYKHNSEKVIQRFETPVDILKTEQQAWYRALPIGGILWKNAIASAEKIGFSKATANRLLNNVLLFKKNGELYERRIS